MIVITPLPARRLHLGNTRLSEGTKGPRQPLPAQWDPARQEAGDAPVTAFTVAPVGCTAPLCRLFPTLLLCEEWNTWCLICAEIK